tara:strand:- start:492 stop:677 length:186 start_codon:yes stop_codon:yes gene_type:complete
MSDLITALGLLFFIEGLLLALFPSRIKNMLKIIETMAINKLRNLGLFFLIIGFVIIWYMRH